jgi:hypothetical protein
MCFFLLAPFHHLDFAAAKLAPTHACIRTKLRAMRDQMPFTTRHRFLFALTLLSSSNIHSSGLKPQSANSCTSRSSLKGDLSRIHIGSNCAATPACNTRLHFGTGIALPLVFTDSWILMRLSVKFTKNAYNM